MQAKLAALALKYGSKILIAIVLLLSLYAWDAHRLHEAAREQHDIDMGLLDKRNKEEAKEAQAKFDKALKIGETNAKRTILSYAKIIEGTATAAPIPARVVRVTGVGNSQGCGTAKTNVSEGDIGGTGITNEYELAPGNRESLEQVQRKIERMAKLSALVSQEIRDTHIVE